MNISAIAKTIGLIEDPLAKLGSDAKPIEKANAAVDIGMAAASFLPGLGPVAAVGGLVGVVGKVFGLFGGNK
jgi:hypothetical protein